MTKRTIWLPAMVACAVVLLASEAQAQAPAQPPKPLRTGDVLSGELRVMRSRAARGKPRVNTYQVVTTEGRRIPGPDGLCNLETGPELSLIHI